MNETERDRIAASVNALRPDWPLRSIRTFIDDKLRFRGYRDTAIAFAYIACDPETQNPGRILENGPWWAAVTNTADKNTPRQPPWCRQCMSPHWPDDCTTPEAVPPPPDFKAAREALKEDTDAG